MVDAVLPRAQAAANGGGPFTREWYDFFRAIQPLTADNTELQAEINAILVRLEALEDAPIDYATINGLASVEVLGSIESGLVQILLEGDTDAPGNTYYYGTDATGVKGWFERRLDTLADVDLISTPPTDGQVLIYDAGAGQWVAGTVTQDLVYNRIDADGDIRVAADGSLRITN